MRNTLLHFNSRKKFCQSILEWIFLLFCVLCFLFSIHSLPTPHHFRVTSLHVLPLWLCCLDLHKVHLWKQSVFFSHAPSWVFNTIGKILWTSTLLLTTITTEQKLSKTYNSCWWALTTCCVFAKAFTYITTIVLQQNEEISTLSRPYIDSEENWESETKLSTSRQSGRASHPTCHRPLTPNTHPPLVPSACPLQHLPLLFSIPNTLSGKLCFQGIIFTTISDVPYLPG